ncbi:MAG: response regulator [Lachnospiraceae bacterium]|nr:response regulator [Lachnospiraceae bacterium]
MEPPLSFKAQKAVGDFYVVPVYLEGAKINIVISVDSDFVAGETPENTGAVISSGEGEAATGDGNTVLVVDDSRMSRLMMKGILEKADMAVVAEAANGEDGVEAYKKFKPDIVTLDITMPKMDGLEALEQILKFDPEAKVIMITAAGQQDKLIKALKTGAKRFINKPFNEEEIVRNIKEIL